MGTLIPWDPAVASPGAAGMGEKGWRQGTVGQGWRGQDSLDQLELPSGVLGRVQFLVGRSPDAFTQSQGDPNGCACLGRAAAPI